MDESNLLSQVTGLPLKIKKGKKEKRTHCLVVTEFGSACCGRYSINRDAPDYSRSFTRIFLHIQAKKLI